MPLHQPADPATKGTMIKNLSVCLVFMSKLPSESSRLRSEIIDGSLDIDKLAEWCAALETLFVGVGGRMKPAPGVLARV